MPDRQDAQRMKDHLDNARHQLDLTMAGIWGAVRGTAPADRWDGARASLEAAAGQISEAMAVLASMDKLEPYCTVCGEPVLHMSVMGDGWSHFREAERGAVDVGHKAELDWRPTGEGASGAVPS